METTIKALLYVSVFIIGMIIGYVGTTLTLNSNKDVVSVDLIPSTPLAQYRENDGVMYTNDYLIRYTQTDIDCMTANVYFEAGNQTIEGKKLVAKSVMNRVIDGRFVRGKYATVCNVVTSALYHNGVPVRDKCQYSWFCDGKSDRPDLSHPLEHRAWTISNEVAKAMLNGSITYESVLTHYHKYTANPNWKDDPRMIYINRVGAHLTYNEI